MIVNGKRCPLHSQILYHTDTNLHIKTEPIDSDTDLTWKPDDRHGNTGDNLSSSNAQILYTRFATVV